MVGKNLILSIDLIIDSVMAAIRRSLDLPHIEKEKVVNQLALRNVMYGEDRYLNGIN